MSIGSMLADSEQKHLAQLRYAVGSAEWCWSLLWQTPQQGGLPGDTQCCLLPTRRARAAAKRAPAHPNLIVDKVW